MIHDVMNHPGGGGVFEAELEADKLSEKGKLFTSTSTWTGVNKKQDKDSAALQASRMQRGGESKCEKIRRNVATSLYVCSWRSFSVHL